MRLIDVETLEVIHEANPAMGHVYSLAWAERADGRYLAGCGLHGAALWKVDTKSPVRMDDVVEFAGNWCLATVLNPEGRAMVWANEQRQLNAWDVVAERKAPLHAPDMLQGWHGLTFLPDGQSVLYISTAGVAEVWNIKDDRRIDSIGEPGTFGSQHIALSPNGKWLAALTQADTVSIWHRPTGKHVFSMRPETSTVWSLAWDASSTQLAIGQSDGGLAVWHLPKIKKKLAESGLPWQDED